MFQTLSPYLGAGVGHVQQPYVTAVGDTKIAKLQERNRALSGFASIGAGFGGGSSSVACTP